jgi:anti-sigma-K factor RskA
MNADVHTLAGAYALDALPADEAAAFATHLEQCAPCRQEVAELRATAAQLGIAATERPPDALRERVLQATRQTRQVPPTTTPSATTESRRTRARLLLAAAAAAVVLAGGVFAIRPLLDDSAQPSSSNGVMAVMKAPDARTSMTGLQGGGRMTVVSSRGMGQAVVMGERLPRLDREHDYQLWLVDRAGTARSAEVLFDGSSRASTGPTLVKGLRPGDQIAITREPAGGSDQATTAPLGMTQTT